MSQCLLLLLLLMPPLPLPALGSRGFLVFFFVFVLAKGFAQKHSNNNYLSTRWMEKKMAFSVLWTRIKMENRKKKKKKKTIHNLRIHREENSSPRIDSGLFRLAPCFVFPTHFFFFFSFLSFFCALFFCFLCSMKINKCRLTMLLNAPNIRCDRFFGKFYPNFWCKIYMYLRRY